MSARDRWPRWVRAASLVLASALAWSGGLARASARAAPLAAESAATPEPAAESEPIASPSEQPTYEKIRSDEDWSRFRPDPGSDDPTDRLKNVALGSATSLSLGGQLRLRSEHYRQPEFGLEGVPRHDLQLYRAHVHAELRSRGGFRTFVELGSAFAVGGELAERPIDEDRLWVRQAFWEAELADARLRMRLGRQELSLGSGRMDALRDGPNVRRSFDGVRVTLRHARGEVEALAVAEVAAAGGAFDDLADPAELLWGVYTTTKVASARDVSLDAYYLGLRREDARFGDEVGLDLRHSLGSRLFGTLGPYDWNAEAIVQAGTFAARPTLAWTVATDQGLTGRWGGVAPRVGLRANATSGGATDPRRLGTFDPLYPNLAYFSQLTLVSPQNHLDVHPRLTVDVRERVQIELAADWFWRTSLRDTIYAPPGVPVGAVERYAGRFVGTEVTASVETALGRHASLVAYVARLWAGPAVRSLGGRDVDLLAFWLTYVF
jgi:hypothetical protein